MPQRRGTYHIPERFLRQIWKQQRFNSNELQSTDGQRIEILSPGELNRDGGPDFIDAAIRIGGILFRGNVEIHQEEGEWIDHAHDNDPKYNAVILHVVLRRCMDQLRAKTASRRSIPTLVLEDFLTQSYRETWQSMILSERAERLSTIPCYPHNASVPQSIILPWLQKLSTERLELKVRRFDERLKELVDEQRLSIKEPPPPRYEDVPFAINPEDLPPPTHDYSTSDYRKRQLWDQLLYEGLMEGLGYSKNQEPMLRLAHNLRLTILHELSASASREQRLAWIEAMLFGVSGLLSPRKNQEADRETQKYLNERREQWAALRPSYHGACLQESDWQFFRLRPENFPTVRLAGAARLVVKMFTIDMVKLIIQTVKRADTNASARLVEIEELLLIPADTYWLHHYLFGERTAAFNATLLGKSRVLEIILNVIVPICLLYARVFKDKEVRAGVHMLYTALPPTADNTIIRMIETQLLRGRSRLDSASKQQGALQLYKFFCAERRCQECAIGSSLSSAMSQ